MSQYGFDDARGPWSLFLPVTLAIIVGVLGAQAIGWAIRVVFPDSGAAAVSPSAQPQSNAVDTQPRTTPAIVGEPPAPAASAVPASSDAPRDAASRAAAGDVPPPTTPSAGLSAFPPTPASPAAVVATPSADSARSPVDPAMEQLQGPVAARRDGDARACINGTVAVRSDNGWQQELSSDSPVRCTQSIP